MSPVNAAWHKEHKMPRNATEDERIEWHIAHKRHCDCRPVPPKLAAAIKAHKKGTNR